MNQWYCGLVTAALVIACTSVHAEQPLGWQGMRVIHQEGYPQQIMAGDLDGNGRDDLIIINTRQSRLDIYRWLDSKDRQPAIVDVTRPNDLPMAPQLKREEVTLEQLPRDVVIHDLDGDGKPELIVLATPPNKVIVFRRDEQGEWQQREQWELLPGTIASHRTPMLVHRRLDGKHELFISYDEGIQTLSLEVNSRPAWLAPRETKARNGWWLIDFDGDGDADLVEWSRQANQTVRWYENVNGQLLPAQVLNDQAAQDMAAMQIPGHGAQLLLLGGAQGGMLRRYALSSGKAHAFARQQALPMTGGNQAIWCGLKLGDIAAAVSVDPKQPRLLVRVLGNEGWRGEESYPIISDVQGIVAPVAEPGTLLLWSKNSGDLHVSRWDDGRLSYPTAMPQSAEVEDRKIIALSSTGTAAWWVQKVGDHLDLYVWDVGSDTPVQTRFEGIGTKADKATWIGGHRILFMETYARNAKLASIVEDKTVVSEPAHLKRAELSQFQLIDDGKTRRLARLADGVLQWVGQDMHPEDQIMLPEGDRLVSYIPNEDGSAWALKQGGEHAYLLKPDAAGIMRVDHAIRLNGGQALVHDLVLGIILIDHDRIVRLSEGQPRELKLLQTIDSRTGRASGVREATIHRVFTAKVLGFDRDDVIFCDDRRHQWTLMRMHDDELVAVMSWPVFEDKRYPYGSDGSSQLIQEPRAAVGLDIDGDGFADMAMLCHDRLIIYLGRESE